MTDALSLLVNAPSLQYLDLSENLLYGSLDSSGFCAQAAALDTEATTSGRVRHHALDASYLEPPVL